MNKSNVVMSTPVVSMKRYFDIVVIKVEGLENINNFLEMIQMQTKYPEKIKAILPSRCKYDKSYGIDLIQINNVLDNKGEVVALCTDGTVTSAFINDLTKHLYHTEN